MGRDERRMRKEAERMADEAFMASPVTDSDRLEAIFQEVAGIRRVVNFWSIVYGAGIVLVALAYFIEVT